MILNRNDYDNMILKILNDTSKFKQLNSNPTLLREGQLQRFLLKLKKKGVFDDENGNFNENAYKKVYPVGSGMGKIYGLPKTHKLKEGNTVQNLTVRPIISSIGTYNYEIAKYLTNKLSPYIPTEFTVKDSFTFVKLVSEINMSDKYLVSYDVNSLFTSIPLKQTIDIAVNVICTNEPNSKISEIELKKLFYFATSQGASFGQFIYGVSREFLVR